MNEMYAYRGHSIDLHLDELQGNIRWTYFIDAQYCSQTKRTLVAVDSARAEALAQAYRSIDKLDAIGSRSVHSEAAAVGRAPASP